MENTSIHLFLGGFYNKMKILLFDSSSLVSMAMNGLLDELVKLKSVFDGKFIIPLEVRREIIDRPLEIKKFELEALRLKKLVMDKVLEFPSVLGISDSEISTKTKEYLDKANNIFLDKKRNSGVHLIDSGETACIALSKILSAKKIENIIVIDERTTRMLGENPEGMKKFLEQKFHTKITLQNQNFELFKGLKFIRSTELIFLAYKKGFINLNSAPKEKILDALLYGLKFKGCSISDAEIEEMKRL